MKKYICETCGYVYDPEVGDPCPVCGVGKDDFSPEE